MRALYLASAGLLITLVISAGQVDAGNGAHRNAIRNFLIVKHCGLATYEVTTGFRIEVLRLIDEGEISPSAAKTDRDSAAEEVRRQWRNRGMGHGDPRCLTQGRAAVRHFLAVLNAEE